MNLSKSILVVDDEEGALNLLSRFLKLNRFPVKTAKNGKEALESIQAEQPKLVILDVKMPEMNGIETLKWIRENYPDINVIMLSAAGQQEIVEESLNLGAKGFITKPMDLKLLLSKINNIFGTG